MKKPTRKPAKTQQKPRPKETGDPVLVRVQPELAGQLDDWRRKQEDIPGRPEAIRRLVEVGLTVRARARGTSRKTVKRAAELASKVIDKQIDPTAPPAERAERKRRILKGPSNFLDVRKDRSS